ncbi:MAG TPA: hypothetical protein VF367_00740 [Candidatus Limnocylindria bacterium]
MNRQDLIDRDAFPEKLDAWLREGSTAAPDYVLDAVLDQLPGRAQRRGRGIPLSWLAPSTAAWGAAAAAVIIIAMVAGGTALQGAPMGAGPSEPRATPINAVDLATARSLAPGRYAVPDPLPEGLSFEVPTGWFGCTPSRYEPGVCTSLGQAEIGVSFLIVDDVVADPCTGELRGAPVGPGLDDLASAIASMPGFQASAIEAGTVDGHDARTFTVTAVDRCPNLTTWITPSRTNGVAAGEANLVRIVDVNGVRVVLAGAYHPMAVGPMDAEEQRALIEGVVESVRIEGG